MQHFKHFCLPCPTTYVVPTCIVIPWVILSPFPICHQEVQLCYLHSGKYEGWASLYNITLCSKKEAIWKVGRWEVSYFLLPSLQNNRIKLLIWAKPTHSTKYVLTYLVGLKAKMTTVRLLNNILLYHFSHFFV